MAESLMESMLDCVHGFLRISFRHTDQDIQLTCTSRDRTVSNNVSTRDITRGVSATNFVTFSPSPCCQHQDSPSTSISYNSCARLHNQNTRTCEVSIKEPSWFFGSVTFRFWSRRQLPGRRRVKHFSILPLGPTSNQPP